MEDSKTLPFFLQLGRKNIPQLKPRGVDGCFGTGASQDYLVGFHQLTILTGQGNIRELLVVSKVSKERAAFPKLWHFVSYDRQQDYANILQECNHLLEMVDDQGGS